MHLVPALLAPDSGTGPLPFEQATRSICAPARGLATLSDLPDARGWAEGCIRFNESVLEHLRRTPSIRTVVLSSPFTQITYDRPHVLRRRDDGSVEELPGSVPTATAALKATVDAIRADGSRFQLELNLALGEYDGEPCARLIVPAPRRDERRLVEDLAEAVQRSRGSRGVGATTS